MILLDTSGVFAALNSRDPEHTSAHRILVDEAGPRILSPFVLAELDYLVGRRAGQQAAIDLLTDVADGRYELAPFEAGDVALARDLIVRYSDLGLGLADASVVVLAGRHNADRVLTLDQRHFRALRTPAGRAFTLLPADAG